MRISEILFEGVMTPEDKTVLATIVKWHNQNFDLSKVVIPKKYQRKENDYYYRGVELADYEVESLYDGESITLPSKGFSSWTLDKEVAHQFADGSGSGRGIVIRKDSSELNVILNIDYFFFINRLKASDYLRRPNEQEIIVRDTGLTITQKDIA